MSYTGTCDWGYCDEETVALRVWQDGYLAVCKVHMDQADPEEVIPLPIDMDDEAVLPIRGGEGRGRLVSYAEFDARTHWGVEGPSIDGSVGEDCGFGINIRDDGTGYIVGWAQYATDRIVLDLTPRRLRALRDMLMRNAFDDERLKP